MRRYCYLSEPHLFAVLQQPKIIDAVLDQLEVPGRKCDLRALSLADKISAARHQIEHYRRTPTSVWRDVDTTEVLAATIFRAATLSDRVKQEIFSDRRVEADLVEPVARWLASSGQYDVLLEVPMGLKRCDVVGRARAAGAGMVISIELKNDYGQLKRGFDQLVSFAEYSSFTYLALSPYVAAEYLDRHSEGVAVRHWDADALNRRLRDYGFGLLIVEGAAVHEIFRPTQRSPSPRAMEDLQRALPKGRPYAGPRVL